MKSPKQRFFTRATLIWLVLILSSIISVIGQTPTISQSFEEKHLAANKNFDEGRNLYQTGNEKSLRLALQKFQAAARLFQEIDYKNGAAGSYFWMGLILDNLNERDSSLEAYQKALSLYRAVNNKQWEADTLYSIGTILKNLGRDSVALGNYQQALSIYRIINNKKWEAYTLLQIRILHTSLKDYKSALDCDKKALQIYRQLKDISGEASMLNNIGFDYETLDNKQLALDYYTSALKLHRKLGDQSHEVELLSKIANIHKANGKSRDALTFYEQAATLYAKIENKQSEAFVYFKIASIYEDLKKASEALKFYDNALTIYRQLGIRYNEAGILFKIGEFSFELGDKRKALESYNQALQIYESLGEKHNIADTLRAIGSVYQIMILPEKALGLFERALGIYRELKNTEEESSLLLVLSSIYSQLGEKEKAQDYANKASSFMQNMLEEYGEIITSLMSGIYSDEEEMLEKLKPAFSKIDKRLTRRNNEETENYFIRISMIALLYMISEDNLKATEYLNKAAEIARLEKIKPGEAMMLYMVGLVKVETDPRAALNDFKKAADIIRSLEISKSFEAIILMAIGGVYSELYEKEKKPEHLAQANNYLNQALILCRTSKDKTMEATLSLILMEFWEEQKQPHLAILYGKQAVNIFQSQRAELKELDKKLQDSYLKRVSDTYETLAEILIAQGRIAEAELVLAMLKEQEFFEYLRRDDKVARELLAMLSLTPSEQEAFRRYDEFADNLTKIGKELGELQKELNEFLTKNPTYKVEKFPKKTRFDKLEKQLIDANKVFNAFLDQLKIKFGQNDERVAKIDSGTQALLKELNQPRTVIISTITGNDRLNLIVTTMDAPRAHVVSIKAADLNKLVFDFREAVKNPSINPQPIGKKLYDILFPADLQKDLDNIKVDTIIWSLDGTLRYIPIAALWDGKQYLVERYANAVITLASRDKINSLTSDRKSWTALGVGVSKPFENFPSLAAVPEELCSVVNDVQSKSYCAAFIKDKSGVISGRILPDDKFTLADFKAHLGRFPIVHIASHFSLNAGNESDSYLLLGGGTERKWSLSAVRESGARFVGVDLLTLSACNTAMTAGKESNGLEVEGFGAMVQKQGARSVLATLWAVADPSTRDLMTEFYQILEADMKIGKAEALRQSQLKLLKGKYKAAETSLRQRSSDIINLGSENQSFSEFKKDANAPFAHPYYWSAFVLYGNLR